MTTATAEFQMVPVAKLHASPLNPRKTFNAQDTFPKRAKAFGLDVRKIVDQAAPKAKPEKAAAKPAKKVQTK